MLKKPMTTEEFFDRIYEILKEKGMMPDILDLWADSIFSYLFR